MYQSVALIVTVGSYLIADLALKRALRQAGVYRIRGCRVALHVDAVSVA
jgi:hypothetical protein